MVSSSGNNVSLGQNLVEHCIKPMADSILDIDSIFWSQDAEDRTPLTYRSSDSSTDCKPFQNEIHGLPEVKSKVDSSTPTLIRSLLSNTLLPAVTKCCKSALYSTECDVSIQRKPSSDMASAQVHHVFRDSYQHGREVGRIHQKVSLFDSPVPHQDELPGAQQKLDDKVYDAGGATTTSPFGVQQKVLKSANFHKRDRRFAKPRPTPRVSKWDPRQPDSPQLMTPYCNPPWLTRMQKKLPWHGDMVQAGGGPWLSLRAWDAPYQYFLQELYFRLQNRADRWWLLVRLGAAGALIITLLIIDVIVQGDLYHIENVEVIYDAFHEMTTGINDWLRQSPTAFSAFVITASLLMDTIFLCVWFQWIVIGDSMRLPLAYAMLYIIRVIVRTFVLFPFPEGYIWKAPKVGSITWPSLTVPYQPSDDFFFSGHIGCGILATVEHFHYRCWWGVSFSAFTTFVQTFIMIVTRGHYMIDMLMGALVALMVHLLAQVISRPVDQWLSLPPRPICPPPIATPTSKGVATDLECGTIEITESNTKLPQPLSSKTFLLSEEDDPFDQQQIGRRNSGELELYRKATPRDHMKTSGDAAAAAAASESIADFSVSPSHNRVKPESINYSEENYFVSDEDWRMSHGRNRKTSIDEPASLKGEHRIQMAEDDSLVDLFLVPVDDDDGGGEPFFSGGGRPSKIDSILLPPPLPPPPPASLEIVPPASKQDSFFVNQQQPSFAEAIDSTSSMVEHLPRSLSFDSESLLVGGGDRLAQPVTAEVG